MFWILSVKGPSPVGAINKKKKLTVYSVYREIYIDITIGAPYSQLLSE